MAIKSFTGPNAFLSNFFIEPDGTHVEGEYQKAKCANESDRSMFDGKPPNVAKKLGQRVRLKPNWDTIRVSVMKVLVSRKFHDHPDLCTALLNTGDQELIEGNWRGDTFWGVCQGIGDNHLGKILMEIRENILRDTH